MTQNLDAPAVGDVPSAESVAHRSSREPEELRGSLQAWLTRTLPADAAPEIVDIAGTSANGQSSETILFDAEWADDGRRTHHELVARIAPAPGDVPVFPGYDLPLQAETIRTVAAHSTVPVPHVHWVEPDASVLGTPFFVMGRVDGEVPPDVLPYTFGDNWLHDATTDRQDELARAAVGVLADLHGIDDPERRFAGLRPTTAGDRAIDQRIAQAREWYEFCVADSGRSPLIDRAFAWVDAHLPTDPGPTTLSWGDARIGNVMWRDFQPVAVLDWEMATLGPPELDLGWLLYSHRIFQDIAEMLELPGMPDFLRPDDAASIYESLSGYTPRDLEFFLTFAALQWGVVFLRVGTRQIHFGEMAPVAEVDELLRNRDGLEAMLAGTYWT